MSQPGSAKIDWLDEYQALTARAGVVELGHRTRIELTGNDRATFLHNLCTNEIRKLPTGVGCEAFFTTVQGKTLGHGLVFATADALVVDTVAGQAETLLAHLHHYLVCEQVELTDRSQERLALLLSGPDSQRVLETVAGADIPRTQLAHATAQVAGKSVWLGRFDFAGPLGYLISAAAGDAASVQAALIDAGAEACLPAALKAARIEWGFPLFGQDITAANLPQEVNRDARAISFVKGCYLGQETVARIDALGHVNKMLVGVRFDATKVPPPGCELSANGQEVGQVTSSTYSPKLDSPLALAYVRRGSNAPGARLNSAVGDAEVVKLPV